jgi:hypothetical protein
MRKFAALVVTRNRPALLKRSVMTFLTVAQSVGMEINSITIADESENADDTSAIIAALGAKFPRHKIWHVRGRSRPGPLEGPGVTRALGLTCVAQSDFDHNGLFMFDDDMCFVDCIYQGSTLQSDGSFLLTEAASIEGKRPTVLGCQYSGRQDLSALEHVSSLALLSEGDKIGASVARHEIRNEAPAEISAGFLFISAPANQLWSFLPWYNEDYFWLRRAAKNGWNLQKSVHTLAHAPEDGFTLTYDRLLFEHYGEALWAASGGLPSSTSSEEMRSCAIKALDQQVKECAATLSVLRQSMNSYVRTQFTEPIERVRSDFESLVRNVIMEEGADFLKHLRQTVDYCNRQA